MSYETTLDVLFLFVPYGESTLLLLLCEPWVRIRELETKKEKEKVEIYSDYFWF